MICRNSTILSTSLRALLSTCIGAFPLSVSDINRMNRSRGSVSLFRRPQRAAPCRKKETLTDSFQAHHADEPIRHQVLEREVSSDKIDSLSRTPSSDLPKHDKEIRKDIFQTITGETMKLYQIWEEESNERLEISADKPFSHQVRDEEFPNKKIMSLLSPPKSDTPRYYTLQTSEGESAELHQIWEEDSINTYEVSLELSQHDPRRERNSTAELNVPRYITVIPYGRTAKARCDAIAKARCDAIEAGLCYLRNYRPQHVPPHRPLSVDSYTMSGISHSMRTIKTSHPKSLSTRKRETSNNSMTRQQKSFANRTINVSVLTHLPPCVPSKLKATDYDTVQIIEESWRRELLSFPVLSFA